MTGATDPSAAVEAFAASAPESTAVDGPDASVSYAQLAQRKREVAAALAAAGVVEDDCVALYAPRSTAAVAGLLGAHHVGAGFLVLDPRLPQRRLAMLVDDARPRALLTAGDPPAWCALPRVPLEPPSTAGAGTSAAVPPAALAYVIYTSGSTGTPKGVAIERRNLAAFATAAADHFALSAADRVMQFMPLTFDGSVEEIFPVLCRGGTLVICPDAARTSFARFEAFLEERAITVAHLPPTFWHEWARHRRHVAGRALAALRLVVLGGERLDLRAVEAWHRGFSSEAPELVNVYGSTEATCFTTAARLGRGTDAQLVGRPIGETVVRLVGDDGEVVEEGIGEAVIAGPCVGRGYLNRPAETAARFGEDPAGVRTFRTGDLLPRRAEAQLEFAGRIDDQIKIRGFRVEPGEVEAALLECPGVREAAVVVRDPALAPTLAAFVVADGEPSPSALRAQLAERLPDHMIPAEIVGVKALPRTSSEKIDRDSLAAGRPAPGAAPPAAPQRAPAEEVLAGVRAAIGADSVALDSDLISQGADSLALLRLVSRLASVGIRCDTQEIASTPTVGHLVDLLTDRATRRAELAAGRGALVDGAAPASPAQEGMWLQDQITAGAPNLTLVDAFVAPGGLDAVALQAALRDLARRHEPLRSTFLPGRDGLAQIVDPEPPPLAVLERDAPEADAQALAAAAARRPFDLEHGPLVRVELVTVGAGRRYCLVSMHHLVSDAWSAEIFAGELAELYDAHRAGRAPALEPPAARYADFAAWHRERLTRADAVAAIAERVEHLRGTPLDVALVGRVGERLSAEGGRVPVRLRPEIANLAMRAGSQARATLAMVCLAAYGITLRALGAGDDMLVGVPVSTRPHPAFERLIGLFVDLQPIRLRLPGDASFSALLASTRAEALAAFRHFDIPYSRLVERLAPPRTLGGQPLVRLGFGFHRADTLPIPLPGAHLTPVRVDPRTSNLELTLQLWRDFDGSLAGFVEHSTDSYDAALAQQVAAGWSVVIEAAVERPHGTVADLGALAGDHDLAPAPAPSRER